jgi:hypothetical protein
VDPLNLKALDRSAAGEKSLDNRLRHADFGELEHLYLREKKPIDGNRIGDEVGKKAYDVKHVCKAEERGRRQRAWRCCSNMEREVLEAI